MLAILNSLIGYNFPNFQPIFMIPKFMVQRALSDKTYLSLGLLSPLKFYAQIFVYLNLCQLIYLLGLQVGTERSH